MTMTTDQTAAPRPAALARPAAIELAGTEYQRMLHLLRTLSPEQWAAPTECPGWSVREMVAHVVGMVDMAASLREQMRQTLAARRRGGSFIDALTALQVDEREGAAPAELVRRFEARWPKALSGRRRTPGLVRRRTMPVPQEVGGEMESWSIGYLVDVILTRDPWMHRVDITRATGAEHWMTADHDGVLIADVVAEWATRHGQPYSLRLTGPAGGSWSAGSAREPIEMDAVEFCRLVSGRGPADGLLATQVPF